MAQVTVLRNRQGQLVVRAHAGDPHFIVTTEEDLQSAVIAKLVQEERDEDRLSPPPEHVTQEARF